MSGIRSKISSIEADDDVVSKALGLRPIEESNVDEPLKPVARDTPSEKLVRPGQELDKAPEKNLARTPEKAEKKDPPIPAIVSRPTQKPIYDEHDAPRWPLYTMIGFSLLWLVGTIVALSSIYSLSVISSYSATQLGGVAFLVLFPILLMAVAYYAFRQLAGITSRAEKLEAAAESLMKVDETVVRRATEMSGVVKGEIDKLNSGIDTALTRVSTLESVLHEQTEKLGETSLSVEDKTQKITERLSTEREALWSISNSFDQQMKVLTESLDTHSENLATSTKTAEQKIQEARVSVENTASKINQTSDLIRNNTMEAASTLSGSQDEILRLSDQLKQRASELDEIYQKHGQDLNAMIAQLKNEQEALNHSLEERLSKMRDVALSAQVSAERLTEASEAGRQTVMSLSEASKLSESTIQKRFSDLEEMVELSNAKAETINEKAARRVQDSLSQTRKEISRIETDMMDLQTKLTTAASADFEPTAIEAPVEAPLPVHAQSETVEIPAKKKSGFLNIHPIEDEPAVSHAGPQITPEQIEPKSSLTSGLRPASTPESLYVEPEKAQDDTEFDLRVDRTIPRSSVTEPDNVSRSWWKNMFGKTETASPALDIQPMKTASPAPVAAAIIGTTTAASAAVVAAATPVTKHPVPSESDVKFLEKLVQNGLSPNAIIDNGCVIKAVENRMSKGTKAMSIGVANRIGEPVRHFSKLMGQDPNLKTDVINFAVKFHHGLSGIADNPIALQDRFETQDGRLFLLCDAALNS